jgi:HSP20 family molecular chaperone IbpA
LFIHSFPLYIISAHVWENGPKRENGSQFDRKQKQRTTTTIAKPIVLKTRSTAMIFVRRQPASIFNPFFMSSQPEAYIFPHLIQEKVSTKDGSGQVVNTNSSSDTNKIIHNGRNVNVMEQEEAWVIYMDLPGVKGENVDIEEDNGTLKVNAQRKAGDKVLATYQQHFALDPKTADLSKLSTELADSDTPLSFPESRRVVSRSSFRMESCGWTPSARMVDTLVASSECSPWANQST